MLFGNAIVGQSGGPTAAINASLAGVITAVKNSRNIGKLYGAFNGIEGVLKGEVCDLDSVITCENDIKLLIGTPAAALGSCRLRLPPSNASDSESIVVYEKLFSFFKMKNIRYFFYIGGNDSMDTVQKLSEYSTLHNYNLRVIGIPKTIDNDLVETDHTPGFGSAAKFVAVATQEIIRDCSVYRLDSVTIIEIMGRYAGWLTAAASLSGTLHDSGAAVDYIYLPEKPFSNERFICDTKAALKNKNNVVIAASEGLRYKNGDYLSSSRIKTGDKFGHLSLSGSGKVLEELIKTEIGCKTRSVELNVLQRCASHIASKTDLDEAFTIGYRAVNEAEKGLSGVMLAIKRLSNKPYEIEINTVPASSVANIVKYLPDEYINDEGNNVTELCVRYLKPLVAGEPETVYKNGLPVHFVIPPEHFKYKY